MLPTPACDLGHRRGCLLGAGWVALPEVAAMFEPSMLALYAVGAFYAVLGVSLACKARKPSCRTCAYWQDCLEKQLAITSTPPKRCL